MRENKRFLWVFLIIILFFGVTFFQIFEYSRRSQNLIQKQTYFTLSEHAEAVRIHLQQEIGEQFNLLETLGDYISQEKELSLENGFDFGEYIISFASFDKVGIANGETGIVIFKDGTSMNISEENFFQNSMQGNRSMDHYQEKSSGEYQVILAIPIYRDEKVESVLMATLKSDFMEACIRTDFYERSSNLFITDSKGDILNFGQEQNSIEGQKNVLAYLKGQDFDIKGVIQNMDRNLGNSFYYIKESEKRYTTYIPLELDNWYLFCSAPEDSSVQFANEFAILCRNIIFKITVFSGLVCILIYFMIKKSGAGIKKEHERFKLAQEAAGMISFEGDYRKNTVVVNANYFSRFGRKPKFQRITDFTKHHPFILEEDQDAFLKMGLDLSAGKENGDVEYRFLCKNGSVQWNRLVYRVWHDSKGLPLKCYGMIVPIDQQMKEISKLQMQVEKDPMTGVLNRTAFEIYVNLSFQENAESQYHALLLIDLDNFKKINDGYGHALGDHALMTTAKILKTCVDSSGYVGRLGGDEFAVFLKNASGEEATKKAAEICEALEKAEMKSNEAVVTCSIGIACSPQNGCGFSTLYQLADKRLYKVKGSGKNSYCIVD